MMGDDDHGRWTFPQFVCQPANRFSVKHHGVLGSETTVPRGHSNEPVIIHGRFRFHHRHQGCAEKGHVRPKGTTENRDVPESHRIVFQHGNRMTDCLRPEFSKQRRHCVPVKFVVSRNVEDGDVGEVRRCPANASDSDMDVSGEKNGIGIGWRRRKISEFDVKIRKYAKPHAWPLPLLKSVTGWESGVCPVPDSFRSRCGIRVGRSDALKRSSSASAPGAERTAGIKKQPLRLVKE